MSFNQIKQDFDTFKVNFDREKKRVCKTLLPRANIQIEVLYNLISIYNTVTTQYIQYYHSNLLNDIQINYLLGIYRFCKFWLVRAFRHCAFTHEPIEDYNTFYAPIVLPHFNNMADTEFLTLINPLIPRFDGSIESKQAFLDSLELVNRLVNNNAAKQDMAVSVIKTKLTGNARTCVTNEQTVQELINRLNQSIHSESSSLVLAKLMNTKQYHKSASDFGKEIVKLTEKLQSAYISEGIEFNLSKKFATDNALKALSNNCNNNQIKIVISALTVTDIEEAVAKFITCSNEAQSSNSIFHVRQNNNFNRNNFNNRNNQGNNNQNNNYRNNYNRNNQNNNNQNNNYRNNFNNRNNQDNNNQNNNNYRNNFNRNNNRNNQNNNNQNNNRRNVNHLQSGSGNGDPSQVSLGDLTNI